MGWTTPRTWSAAEIVDEDHLNEQIRDNTVYLKTEADKHDDCVMRDGTTVVYAAPSGARVKDGIYQNTSGKTRFVALYVTGAAADDECTVYVENDSTPAVAATGVVADTNSYGSSCFFLVPSNWYYQAYETTATITISSWVEWDTL